MNILTKTGVPIKTSGDGLSHQDINNINTTVNSNVDATNYLLKNFCNINDEVNDYSQTFTLSEAIEKVPENRKKLGIKIRFLNVSNTYVEYIYSGNDISSENWSNEENWSPVTFKVLDGGEW